MKTYRQAIMCVLLFVALSVAAFPRSQAAKSQSDSSWTFMVYLDGDNSLDAYAPYSLGMMEEVGSTANVDVVVLWDGLYQPAYMYKVLHGGLAKVNGFPLNGQEVNMGDGSTLQTFVDFAVSKFQAQHYILVMWDHGNDVEGICWDEHPDDHLTHAEVAAALSGHHIDILAFDACLMTMIEVAYEYNQYGLDTDYLVGSENYVPVAGYPYNAIFEGLNQNPAMTELEASQMIVQLFAEFYQPRPHFSGGVMASLSALDVAKIDEVAADLALFTEALIVDIDHEANHEMISEARGEGNLPWSEYGWDLYTDLPTLVEYLTVATSDPTVRAAGNEVLSSLSQAIVALGNSEPMESAGARGMGIWFPASYHMMWGYTTYAATKFAGQGWLDFLYAYWNDDHT